MDGEGDNDAPPCGPVIVQAIVAGGDGRDHLCPPTIGKAPTAVGQDKASEALEYFCLE
jgi:hypothetical protein